MTQQHQLKWRSNQTTDAIWPYPVTAPHWGGDPKHLADLVSQVFQSPVVAVHPITGCRFDGHAAIVSVLTHSWRTRSRGPPLGPGQCGCLSPQFHYLSDISPEVVTSIGLLLDALIRCRKPPPQGMVRVFFLFSEKLNATAVSGWVAVYTSVIRNQHQIKWLGDHAMQRHRS